MKNFNQLVKQAQKMQAQIAKIQEELADKEVEASAGGGMVKVVANGKQEIVSVAIEKEVINSDEQEMLQDLIVAAVNEALRKSKEMMEEELKKVTGGLGLNIPGF
ncbi:MAG: YbaB/EbfC family nucleoid-associated protein [Candidatus Schekmanbacteria bacterium]|nr:MAG: YbaB/EbfC family nucleoid-associated protein [Candidatus Schekmanbacteria bacterium]